jgi:hypothetical protein
LAEVSSDQERVEARRVHLIEVLDRAIAPGRVVPALVEVGLTSADLAVALEASPRTTASWLEEMQPVIKKTVHKERIRELKEVTRFLIANGTIAFQEADWLRDPNRSAGFSTPLELIGQGRWREAGRLYCDDVAAEVPSIFRTDLEPKPARAVQP